MQIEEVKEHIMCNELHLEKKISLSNGNIRHFSSLIIKKNAKDEMKKLQRDKKK